MKISFQITAGAVWLDGVQQQPVNCGQAACQPIGDGVHGERAAPGLQAAQWEEQPGRINGCRWSSVRLELEPETTQTSVRTLSSSSGVPGNVLDAFWVQVEVERRGH